MTHKVDPEQWNALRAEMTQVALKLSTRLSEKVPPELYMSLYTSLFQAANNTDLYSHCELSRPDCRHQEEQVNLTKKHGNHIRFFSSEVQLSNK